MGVGLQTNPPSPPNLSPRPGQVGRHDRVDGGAQQWCKAAGHAVPQPTLAFLSAFRTSSFASDNGEAEARLAVHGDPVHRPSNGGSGTMLAVPLKGSLESLIERHSCPPNRIV